MAATAAGVFHTSYASELRLRHTSMPVKLKPSTHSALPSMTIILP